jgi:hypothetical protein
MTDPVLNDFFIFIANHKAFISHKDIEDFESFLQRRDFEDIQDDIIDFINDLLYWVIRKLDLDNELDIAGGTNVKICLR